MQQTITFHILFFFHTNAGSPRLAEGGSSVELSVGSNRYLNGHVLVLSFPQPNASLTLQNGALNTLITLRIETKADNLFTIMLIRSNAQPNVFGKYVLDVTNQYGGTKIDINIVVIEFLNMNIMVVTLYINIKN